MNRYEFKSPRTGATVEVRAKTCANAMRAFYEKHPKVTHVLIRRLVG